MKSKILARRINTRREFGGFGISVGEVACFDANKNLYWDDVFAKRDKFRTKFWINASYASISAREISTATLVNSSNIYLSKPFRCNISNRETCIGKFEVRKECDGKKRISLLNSELLASRVWALLNARTQPPIEKCSVFMSRTLILVIHPLQHVSKR